MYVWNQIQQLYHLIYFCLSAAYLFCIQSSTDCNWIWFWNSEISGIFFWGTLSLSIWHMHGKQCDFIRRHTVSSNFIVWPPSLSLSSFGQATRTLRGGGASEFLFGNAYAWNDIISMLQTMAQRSKSLPPPLHFLPLPIACRRIEWNNASSWHCFSSQRVASRRACGGRGAVADGRERMHLPKRQILMMLRVVWNTINAYTLSPTRLFTFGAGVDFNETQLERDRRGPARGRTRWRGATNFFNHFSKLGVFIIFDCRHAPERSSLARPGQGIHIYPYCSSYKLIARV